MTGMIGMVCMVKVRMVCMVCMVSLECMVGTEYVKHMWSCQSTQVVNRK